MRIGTSRCSRKNRESTYDRNFNDADLLDAVFRIIEIGILRKETETLRTENDELQRLANEIQSTLQRISDKASQKQQEMGNQIKLLSSSLNQTQQNLLSAQTLSTQHKIQVPFVLNFNI